jgi:excisionase family DNA binding protein
MAGGSDGVLTARAAADALGVSERTIRRAVARGELPATRLAGRYRISLTALERYRVRLAAPPGRSAQPPRAPDRRTPVPAVTPLHAGSQTELIGRERELAVVAGLLAEDSVRLLTLTGPGGVGKTRLALAVIDQVGPHFPGGRWFVPLAQVSDPALLPVTIAQSLGLRATERPAVLGQIARYLRERRALFVLDNVEQIVAAAIDLVALLTASPSLKILVTSREVLRLTEERLFAVPPLATTDPTRTHSLAGTAATPSVRLFVDRARAAEPTFALDATNASAVAAICQRLDGLPLAIELAATRVKLLPPAALLARLGQRLPLLTGGPRDLAARHQTMAAAIAWSYELLDDSQRALFRRFAIFVGGASLAAAEAVVSEQQGARSGQIDGSAHSSRLAPIIVLDGLLSLIDKNLLRQEGDSTGESRLSMLETVREYALARLEESQDVDVVRRRHAIWFLDLAEETFRRWRGPTVSDLRPLAIDQANLRAALAFFEQSGDAERLLRLARALSAMWYHVGDMSEGYDWLARAIAFGRANGVSTAALAEALVGLASQSLTPARRLRARTDLAEAIELLRTVDDSESLAHALVQLGGQCEAAGDDIEAEARFTEAAAIFRRIDHRAGLSLALENLADTVFRLGDMDRAATLADEAVQTARESGDPVRLVVALGGAAQVALVRQDVDQAISRLSEEIDLALALQFRWSVADALVGLAGIADRRGTDWQAARLLGAAVALRDLLGSDRFLHEGSFRRIEANVRERLGIQAFSVALGEGQSLSLEVAIEEARMVVTAPATDEGREEPDGLTAREREVLRLMVDGATNAAIAQALWISPKTVSNHVARILDKLGVETRTAAATIAVRRRLV